MPSACSTQPRQHLTQQPSCVQQTSAPQWLESGSFYLLKALAKEGRGGENLAVGVTLPDGEELRPMPVQGYLFLE